MRCNRLGGSSLEVSEIGLGCMSLPADEAVFARIVHEACDRGVNFFDTADLYGQGENERLLGLALRDRRDRVLIATKVGHRFTPGVPGFTWNPTGAYVLRAVEDCLRRLRTDCIDLCQLHGGTLEDPFDELTAAMEALMEQGKIRAYGISSIRPNVIRRYAAHGRIASVMMQYSLLDRRPEESVFALLQERGIGVIARGPVANGLLADGYAGRLERLPESGYLGYSREELADLLPRLAALAGGGRPFAQLALRFALSAPPVATAVPGASREEQLQANAGAAAHPPLSPGELSSLRALTRANRYESHR